MFWCRIAFMFIVDSLPHVSSLLDCLLDIFPLFNYTQFELSIRFEEYLQQYVAVTRKASEKKDAEIGHCYVKTACCGDPVSIADNRNPSCQMACSFIVGAMPSQNPSSFVSCWEGWSAT